MIESHEDVIEKENCLVIGFKNTKRFVMKGTNQVDFSVKIRNLKDEAKDDKEESGIDDWKILGELIFLTLIKQN